MKTELPLLPLLLCDLRYLITITSVVQCASVLAQTSQLVCVVFVVPFAALFGLSLVSPGLSWKRDFNLSDTFYLDK